MTWSTPVKIARLIALSAAIMTLSSSAAYAIIDDGVIGSEDIEDIKRQPGPFRIEVEYDSVSKAKIDKEGFEDDHLTFSQFSARFGMAFCYFPEHREAYAFAIGYDRTKLDWPENPFFNENYFNTATASLRLYSNRMSDWLWKGQLTATIDTHHMDFNHYLNFDAVMWGRYEYSCDVGMHIGFIVETGMKLDHVYPIFGFDWQFAENWKLNLVYPTDLSLLYTINKRWSAEVGMRFFDVRHRAGWDEPLPGALFRYTNAGVEFGINYKYDPFIEANIHAGSTLKAGELKISDQHGHHTQSFDLDGSAYAGFELVISF